MKRLVYFLFPHLSYRVLNKTDDRSAIMVLSEGKFRFLFGGKITIFHAYDQHGLEINWSKL